MSISVGIGLAFVAMLCWGIGDFLIQRSTRKFGNFETIFLITGFGLVILFPFVYKNLPALFGSEMRTGLLVLTITGIMHFVAALLELESLKRGKIAVVEPIWSLEILSAAFLAFLILGETMTRYEIGIVAFLMIGLFLVSFRGRFLSRRHFLERGVYFAFAGALTMGAAAFLTGWSARLTDPLMASFAVNVFLVVFSGGYLLAKGWLPKLFRDVIQYPWTVFPMVIADNAAWVAYAFALVLIPIGIATALSESYIIIAVVLRLLVNHERLERHQKIGLGVAIAAAVILAAITG
ncbi:MAG: DMT family transporter [Patescibacteria group bacterium]